MAESTVSVVTGDDYKFKFAGNLATVFCELSLCNQFSRAKKLGFKYVEAQFLYATNLTCINRFKEKAGVEITLINSPEVSHEIRLNQEVFGLACLPYDVTFLNTVIKAMEYALDLKCKYIHILAGLCHSDTTEETRRRCFIQNMQSAANMLGEHNIIVVIEPMAPCVRENYFLDSFEKAVGLIQEMDLEFNNVKILMDVFHMQMMGMDVCSGIKKYLPFTGYIQVSQAPLRCEPFSPGPIDFKAVFDLLKELNYEGFIGLEYVPLDKATGYDWLKNYQGCLK